MSLASESARIFTVRKMDAQPDGTLTLMTRAGKPMSRASGPPLMRVVRAAIAGQTTVSIQELEESQIRWAVETGLGPILYEVMASGPEVRCSGLWPLLRAADLTARVVSGEQLDAVVTMIDICRVEGVCLTLLKGISVATQYYPRAHWRPMRDIDVLVDEAHIPRVERVLQSLGYQQQSDCPAEFYRSHHHTMPFHHPKTGVWVEVHRGLFRGVRGALRPFDAATIEAECRRSDLNGRPVGRLSDELQCVYTAAHWALDFPGVGGMAPMLDLVYLLPRLRDVEWLRILRLLEHSAAAAPLYVLVTYLARYHLVAVSPGVLRALQRKARVFRRLNLRLAHSLLDRYTVGGKPFGPLMSRRNCSVVWRTLFRQGSARGNLLRLPFSIVPARLSIPSLINQLRRRER